MIFPLGAQVGADTSAFIGAMGGASRGLMAFTGAAGLASGALAVFAGAAALGSAVNKAREFQTEMVKLNTLVGISQEQVESWSKEIRDLSLELGTSATEMARAMFAISSGGARGQEAMDILTQSAKASELGLGDMASIGRTATAALQAFGAQGLTAEKAIDVLVATVRAGNLEAESLSGSFGKVMGTAAALGLGLEDLGAFVATYTRLGVDAAVATTGLNAALNLILKPQDAARDKMAELGIPVEHLRDVLREDGLNAALMEMKEAIGDDIDALGTVIPNIRAMAGVLGTVGVQAEQYVQIQDEINNSLGLTAEGFETFEKSAQGAFNKFSAQVTEVALAVGELLLPPLTVLLKVIGPLIGLLALAAEGWGLIADAVKDRAVPAIEEALAIMATAPPDDLQKSFAELLEQFKALDQVTLEDLETQLSARVAELQGVIDTGIANEEEAIALRDIEVQKLAALRTVLRGLTEVRGEESDAAGRTIKLTKEEIEAREKQLELISNLVGGLEEEILRLEEGEAAVIDKQLADLLATDATREHVRGLLEKITALEEEKQAQREATQEAELAVKAQERARETLARQRERAQRDVEQAAQRTAKNVELARLNNEMREAQQIAQEMAESIGAAFDDIVSGTKNVADAFADMVTSILQQVQRLLIQRAIVEPLMGALLGQFGPSSVAGPSAADFTSRATELAGQIPGGVNPFGGVSGKQGSSLGSTIIVQQEITFAPNLIDARSSARFFRENRGEIMSIVGEGVQRSSQFAAAVRGA